MGLYKKIMLRLFIIPAAAATKSLQSCPTLCDPIDGSPPGSPVPGILQARTLEWVAISFSNAWRWKEKVKLLSHVWLLATPWTAAHQAPPSMGFSRQEYWSGVPLPSIHTEIKTDKSQSKSLKQLFYNYDNRLHPYSALILPCDIEEVVWFSTLDKVFHSGFWPSPSWWRGLNYKHRYWCRLVGIWNFGSFLCFFSFLSFFSFFC